MIADSDIRWYDWHSVVRNKDRFNFYITTDFATSASEAADYSVISVWAFNNIGDWFWVDGVCKRQLMDQNINDLFRLVQKYKHDSVGVEVSGQQKGFIEWIQGQMIDRNVYFNMASEKNSNKPGIRPVTKKIDRFQTVVPWFKAGKMYFPHEFKEDLILQEAMDELSLATPRGFKSKKDDFIDTISMLAVMPVFRPSEEAEAQQDPNDMWAIPLDEDDDEPYNSYIV